MLKLRVRVSSALRCSYCHDALLATAFNSCPRCGTILHEFCWSEAGPCPTLGCAPRVRRPRLVLPLSGVLAERRVMGVYSGSAVSGAFGALFCIGSAFVLPAFAEMFTKTGLDLPCFLVVPVWSWWVLGFLSLTLVPLKDRWLKRWVRKGLNSLYVTLTIGVGVWMVIRLFSPVIGFDRL